MATNDTAVSSCVLCTSIDTDEMVQCDDCDCWFHFLCVGVTSDIADSDWKCSTCITKKQADDHDKMSSVSSTRSLSKRKELQLQMLEEERKMQAEYIRKKYELLQEDLPNDESTTQQSTSPTEQQMPKAKAQAVAKCATQSHPQQILYSNNQSDIPIHSNFLSVPVASARSTQPSGGQEDGVNQANMVMQNFGQLSAQQIATRQSFAKDLPSFSGHPEDWPIFFSSFTGSTSLCGYSNAENLLRLQKCLKGKALELVRSQLLIPENVPAIITSLRMIFGRPELIIQTLIAKVRNESSPRPEKLETIISFALSVQNMCATMEATGLVNHLANPVLLQELVEKLPAQIKLNWAVHKRTLEVINLSSFSAWLFGLAETISDVTFTAPSYIQNKNESRSLRDKGQVHTHAEGTTYHQVTSEVNGPKCKICNQNCTSVETCTKFVNMSLSEKWDTVNRLRLCRTCLKQHNNTRCRSTQRCGIDGCTFKHNALLHKLRSMNSSIPETSLNISTLPVTALQQHQHNSSIDTGRAVATSTQFTCNPHGSSQQSIYFRVIPVILYNGNKELLTYAFLDEGSSITLMDDSLASELNVSGPVKSLCLKWTGQTHRVEDDSKVVSVQISAVGNSKKYHLHNIRTVKSLNLPIQSLNAVDVSSKYAHLKGIPLRSYEMAAPRLLIGLDNNNLGFPQATREGKVNEPCATKTRLGWVIYGGTNTTLQSETRHEFHSFHICECSNDNNQLIDMIKRYFSFESLGVGSPATIIKPVEEERACRILETKTIRKGIQFEVSLLWKYDKFEMPNSLPMALRRHKCLYNNLKKNPLLAESLHQQLESFLRKGYIRKLTDEELKLDREKIWYLPIFTVTNINKPGKLRIVWDAAARVNGVSLNSLLLKGPDQLVSLPSVLYRFRERPIAICGDIREMFHQVLVNAIDQHVQRFLWNPKHSDVPEVYVMQVLTFGATCSPSCAQFIKNKNAQEYENQFPRAARAIIYNHYVDDFLDSCTSEEDAIQLAKDVKMIHGKAGFEMRNWVSNSQRVIKALGGLELRAKSLNSSQEPNQSERVLGMWWSTDTDQFTFTLSQKLSVQKLISERTRPTKRQLLSVMMTIFDPLGLIAHIIIYIKILMQEVWRAHVEWDDPIGDDHFQKWRNWVSLIRNINKIIIPRCYFKNIALGEHTKLELHVFVDASENAYAAVAYLRATKGTLVECTIVASKTRVAPLKMASIPRLELEAARLGARLAKGICVGHSISFSKKVFWSDSKTVLCWIRSDHRKYRQYVAFRVSEIIELTDMKEWRYIPTKQNVADEATKWNGLPSLEPQSRWFCGPSFLKLPKEMWPKDTSEKNVTTEEIRANVSYHFEIKSNIADFDKFSSWRRLIRTQIYVRRFIWNLRAGARGAERKVGPLKQEEYIAEENHLYRLAQYEFYSDEIAILHKNNDQSYDNQITLEKSSPLFKSTPYLDEAGVLRCRGRIDAAIGIKREMKRPILLPGQHSITRLIIRSFHNRYHHQNTETVLNELHQKYYIPRLRTLLKKERKNCQRCKNQRVIPYAPQMGALPPARLASFTRPFSFIGLDYFGPMYVAVGRRREKRWGVLITCLTIRAIHLEVACSLTSDSCILAIKRFIARRGTPLEIRCDNGTNFHGAEKELAEMSHQEHERIADEFSNSMTKWTYNSPAAPHMGGSWERLVQSVKKILFQILPTRNPTDELLYSMLLEVERVINSRPLTYVPLEKESEEAITPNHFLLGSSNGEKADGVFLDEHVLLRKNWLKAQQFSNAFWKRWVREYLPTLTRRTKWFQPVKPIEIGDVVIIVSETEPRNSWPKGRILEVTRGKDGQVRTATVQTSNGIYVRPAVKLAVLDVRKESKSNNPSAIRRGSVNNTVTSVVEKNIKTN